MRRLKVIQVNLRHSKAASAALLLTLEEGNYDVALIQEPWISGGEIRGLGSRCYKKFVTQGEGRKRAAILAKKNLNIFLKSNYSTNDLTVAQMEGKRGSFLIASAYMAHDR